MINERDTSPTAGANHHQHSQAPAITSEILESSQRPHPAIITMVLLVSEWEFITKPRLVINYAVRMEDLTYDSIQANLRKLHPTNPTSVLVINRTSASQCFLSDDEG